MMTYNELIKNINILLADDDDDYLSLTYSFLKQIGYNVDTAKNGKEAVEKVLANDYQILLLDYFMPELNGEEVVEEIRKTNKELIIILQTGFSGQKPPVETMQKLNIQNYHDKTEGIDRLNLELISAVKIFNQQNEIELTRYRANAIGNLVSGIAQEIKSTLLSVGAGIDVTNLLIQDATTIMEKTNIEKLNKFHLANRASLEKVDKVLSSIIGQASSNSEYVMLSTDVVDIINLMLVNDSKTLGVPLNVKVALKAESYLSGSVNDNIFIICELTKRLMKLEKNNSAIEIVLTEDENNWYFIVSSGSVENISRSDFYLIKRLVISLKDTDIIKENGKVILSMKKV